MNSRYNSSQAGQRFTQAVDRMRGELDRLVEMAWARGEEALGQFRNAEQPSGWSPEVDVVETQESLVVFMNLPGIKAEQVEITLVGNTLEVTAQIESLTLQTADKVYKRERPTGRIQRIVTLPVAVECDSAVAHADQGVFKIEMKKTQERRAHKVPVMPSQEPQPIG